MTNIEFAEHRKRLGLNQREISDSLCVSVWTVYKWEYGTRKIPTCCVKLFCLLYDIPFTLPADVVQPDENQLELNLADDLPLD